MPSCRASSSKVEIDTTKYNLESLLECARLRKGENSAIESIDYRAYRYLYVLKNIGGGDNDTLVDRGFPRLT